MSKSNLTDATAQFMDDMASLMTPWGWPRHVGRMYAYLLIRESPASLDEIAADLGISKSNASVAARTLEQFGNARRHTEPGTKRIHYSAPASHTGPFAAKSELLDMLVRLLDRQSSEGDAQIVSDRFRSMLAFYGEMRDAMQAVIDRTQTEG
jgi:predicted ArsR family transcriptional regulator